MATGTPAPTTGTGKTKKWWIIHVAAGVAAIALIAFGATQCSSKVSEREEKETKETKLVRANESLDSLRIAIGEARRLIGDLGDDNRAKSDTIRMQRDTIDMQRDSIAVLNDSLAVVNGKLIDCRNSKHKQVKQAKPQPKPQPKPKTVTVVKPDTVLIVQQPVSRVGCGGKANVTLNDSQNNGAIVVGGGNCKTDIKLENGSVNNGAIVVGNGNDVVVNTEEALIAADSLARARQLKNVRITTVFYTKSK